MKNRCVIAVMLVGLLLPSSLQSGETIIVLLKMEGCAPCKALERLISNSSIQTAIAKNKVLFKAYYGEQYPKYVKRHNITAYPTMLKFEQNEKGKWIEKDRVVGLRQMDFLIKFLGKGGIIKRTKELPGKIVPRSVNDSK